MKQVEKWLTAGAYICDVSELGRGYYIDNYTFPYEKYMPVFDKLKETVEKVKYRDGEKMTCMGEESVWRVKLQDRHEDRLIWNKIGRRGALMKVFAATEVIAPCDGEYDFLFCITGSAVVCINGKTFITELKLGSAEQELQIKAQLKEGKNSCIIGVMNMHIHCTCALGAEIDDRLEICEDFSKMSSEEIRRCQTELARLFLEKSVIVGDEPVCISFEKGRFSGNKYTFSLYDVENSAENFITGMTISAKELCESDGSLELFSALKLKSGRYAIKTECDSIEGASHSFSKRETVVFPEKLDFGKRREHLVDYYSKNGVVLAALEKNTPFNEKYIEDKIREVNGREDCADFSMHELLRIYGKYHKKLKAEIASKIKRAILDFKYRADEPGETMMYVRSENHQMSFFSCEYIAGILFPDEIFTNSGQRGLFHALKGRYDCTEWIREKGRYGFCEWYSNTYLPMDIVSLADVYDFADYDPDLKYMAKNLLDFIVLLIASHSSKGIMGCVHGRCYEQNIKNPDDEGTSHLMWLLFSMPTITYDRMNEAAVVLATSSYVPRDGLERMAWEDNLETYSRMGIYRYDGRLGVNIYCCRKKDYILSGLLESRKGEFGAQVQAGQLLLDGKVPVFVTCFESMKSNTRPSYWSGQYSIPKTVAYKNFLSHIYRLGDRGYTHCYFPEGKFDCVIQKDGWNLGKINDAYVGVYSTAGYTKTDSGSNRGCELLCDARNTIWLLIAGDKEEFGSFETFIEAVSGGTMTEKDEGFVWKSKACGEIKLSWDGECSADGRAFKDGDLPLISNRFAYSGYGDGYIRLNEDNDHNYLIF